MSFWGTLAVALCLWGFWLKLFQTPEKRRAYVEERLLKRALSWSLRLAREKLEVPYPKSPCTFPENHHMHSSPPFSGYPKGPISFRYQNGTELSWQPAKVSVGAGGSSRFHCNFPFTERLSRLSFKDFQSSWLSKRIFKNHFPLPAWGIPKIRSRILSPGEWALATMGFP